MGGRPQRRALGAVARVIGAMLALICAAAAPAAAARFGGTRDLTPAGGVYATPTVAVGPDGHVLVAWVQRSGLAVRIGRAGHLGAAQTLRRAGDTVDAAGGQLAAAVGANGEAAVAWMSAGGPHNTRVLVSIAPPGRPFGRPDWIDGAQAALAVDGVGVDSSGGVLVTWRGVDERCCENAPIRYAIGSATHAFSRPGTIAVEHLAGGFGQVLETGAGGVLATGEADPAALAVLNGTRLVPVPGPPLGVDAGFQQATTGPGGAGVAVYCDSVTIGPYFGADVGASVQPAAGAWSPPRFVPLPASTLTDGPAADPALALPSDGASVLGLTVGTRMELAIAPRGGAFGGPVAVGTAPAAVPFDPGPTDPQIAAFGPDAALAWLAPRGHGATLDVALQPATGPPSTQVLGPLDRPTAESLAAGGGTAAIAWVSAHRLRVAFAAAG